MASTDEPGASTVAPDRSVEYVVPDWVRVREEDFGLLFYDVRSTKLTFVHSGKDLSVPAFAGPRRVLGLRESSAGRRCAIARLLENLQTKGLIVVSGAE